MFFVNYFSLPHRRAASGYDPILARDLPPGETVGRGGWNLRTADGSPPWTRLSLFPRVSLTRVEARSGHPSWFSRGMPVYLRDCVGDRVPTDLFTEIVNRAINTFSLQKRLDSAITVVQLMIVHDVRTVFFLFSYCLFLFKILPSRYIHSRSLPKKLVREKQVIKQSYGERGCYFPNSR